MPSILPQDQPDIVPVCNDPLVYRMRGHFQYQWDGAPYGMPGMISYDFPDGWLFDNMSIARPLWTLSGLTPDGVQRLAAACHDRSYQLLGALPGLPSPLTRMQCDQILRDMCLAAGISHTQAWIIYEAVSKFGWIAWDQHQREKGSHYRLTPLPATLEALELYGRSPHWSAARRAHLEKEWWCRSCGRTELLQVHHIKPYHEHPELELEESNFITLCEAPDTRCHLKHGHLGDWHLQNPKVREECRHAEPPARPQLDLLLLDACSQ